MGIKNLDFFSFLKKSATAYHAAEEIQQRCETAGFVQLHESAAWKLEAGKSYFVVRGGSLLAMFRMPKKKVKSSTILATHIDSPCLKLKPKAEKFSQGMCELNTELYGAPLLHTWFDRELVIAGQVVYEKRGGSLATKTVLFQNAPVLIPSLALHLDKSVGDKGFLVQKQDHLKALFSLNEQEETFDKWLSSECKGEVVLFDLFLVSQEEPKVFGKHHEFLASPRLDNLTSAFAACEALQSAESSAHMLQMALFFDHEEIGSMSAQGADSLFLEELLQRIAIGSGLTQEDLYQIKSASLCISSDVAHGVHPNFPEKYDLQNGPQLGKGVVFKFNANQKYATSSLSAAPLMQMALKEKIPTQTFASRSDIPSGSTIGSMLAARTGIATVDVGIASLAMHSIRETIALEDETHLFRFLHAALLREP